MSVEDPREIGGRTRALVGRALKKARMDRAYTQKELRKRMVIGTDTIKNIERGMMHVRPYILTQVAGWFGSDTLEAFIEAQLGPPPWD